MRTTPTITVSTTREDDFGAGAVALGVTTGAAALGEESTNTAVVAGFAADAGVEVETAGITTGAFLANFFAGAFLAADFLAVTFLAGAFFATTFLAAAFLAGAFFATTFLAGAFLATTFLAGAFLATFLAATFFAGAFLAADFLAVFLTATGNSSVKCDRSLIGTGLANKKIVP